jgi:hypothetical protein
MTTDLPIAPIAWQVLRLIIAGLIAVGLGLYVYLLAREALGVSRRKE